MKRAFALLILMLFLVNFTKRHNWDKRLIGKWQINAVYVEDKKINLDLVPHCENKENMEFKDSISFRWENYLYRKNRCFKTVTEGEYSVERFTDFLTKNKAYRIEIAIAYQRKFDLEYEIVSINDTLLVLKKTHENVLKYYKKI